MKSILRNIGLGLMLLGSLSACDLDTQPTTSLNSEAVFKDTKNADDVMRGSWNYIFNTGSSYASIGLGSLMLNDDFAGSDAVRASSYGFSSSYNLTNGYGRGEYNSVLWDLVYDPINNCNNVLANIDKVSGSEDDKARIKGQAYATRGYLYMLLATHYSFAVDKDPNAVCVPIYTKPTTMGQALTGEPAASVKEVYDQAIRDLKEGIKYIPETYSHGANSIDQYKIDHTVAMGILARTALYARQWQDAYDYATKVLAQNNTLMTEKEYKGGFNDCTNPEWIWSYSSTIEDNSPSYIFHFKDNTTSGSYYGCLCMDPYFLKNYADNDYRKDLFQTWGGTPQSQSVIKLLDGKFRFKDIDNQLGDIVLMRVSEMYLVKAEAAYHLGKVAEAQEALHTLQQARMKEGFSAPAVTATGDALLKDIWMERRKELWGEGFALTDLIRNQQSVERKEYEEIVTLPDGSKETRTGHTRTQFPDESAFTPNSKYYLFRIPEKEELQNKNLYSKHQKLDFYR